VALAIEIINAHLGLEGPAPPILNGLQAALGSVLTEAISMMAEGQGLIQTDRTDAEPFSP
jgi:hypothetical protein